MTYNQVVGAVRFRQVRSTPGIDCPDVPLNARLLRTPNGTIFEERFIAECHAAFSTNNEATTPFGPGGACRTGGEGRRDAPCGIM